MFICFLFYFTETSYKVIDLENQSINTASSWAQVCEAVINFFEFFHSIFSGCGSNITKRGILQKELSMVTDKQFCFAENFADKKDWKAKRKQLKSLISNYWK